MAAKEDPRPPYGRAVRVECERGGSTQELLECDCDLEAGKVCADADGRPATERTMRCGSSHTLLRFRLERVSGRRAIGGSPHEKYLAVGTVLLAVSSSSPPEIDLSRPCQGAHRNRRVAHQATFARFRLTPFGGR